MNFHLFVIFKPARITDAYHPTKALLPLKALLNIVCASLCDTAPLFILFVAPCAFGIPYCSNNFEIKMFDAYTPLQVEELPDLPMRLASSAMPV